MQLEKFSKVSANPDNPRWNDLVARQSGLYPREHDVRSEFARDYTRILHCMAYRRLKRKTQVFFATGNDHVCTRIEHVNHVASISYTVARALGLNTELTNAIAIGHDLGHPPFGHTGETILTKLETGRKTERFWHEKNSLWFVDKLETLPDDRGFQRNLDLTYAVRDGIVCHCGEVEEEPIHPRESAMDLVMIQKPGEVEPFTWEGCVVKASDKIAFLGRDIEDAATLKILSKDQLGQLGLMVREVAGDGAWSDGITNTDLIHRFVINLCEESSPELGLRLSAPYVGLMREIRSFSRKNIYDHPRINYFKQYAEVVLGSIFDKLSGAYEGVGTLAAVREWNGSFPLLVETFSDWLLKYSDVALEERQRRGFTNSTVYSISAVEDYEKAVIDYIAGMTDQFAIKVFEELISF